MRAIRLILVVAVVLVITACGQGTLNPVGSSALPAPATPLAASANTLAGSSTDQRTRSLAVATCPDGKPDAPTYDLGAGSPPRLIFFWPAVPNVTIVFGQVERMDSATNVYVPEGLWSSRSVEGRRAFRLGGEGHFRVRYRTLSCRISPPSDWTEFSTEMTGAGEGGVVVDAPGQGTEIRQPELPQPPHDGGNKDHAPIG